jgi:hypothetical protein
MSWTYEDYITMDGSARLTQLRLHIQEVSNKLTQETSADGKSRSSSTLQAYLKTLKDEELSLTGRVNRTAGGISLVRRG